MKKERGLRCTAQEVRVYLGGRKTVTRRPIEPQPKHPFQGFIIESTNRKHTHAFRFGRQEEVANVDDEYIKCPYGVPGDRLYVRETFRLDDYDDDWLRNNGLKNIIYKADMPHTKEELKLVKWKPSIHMPRWASRITLEIKSVRVERVQEISDEDTVAEGFPDIGKYGFIDLWDTLYGKKYPWSSNPWVWAIETVKL